MEVEHENEAWQHSEPSLVHWHGEVDCGWPSPWLCGPSLAQPLMLMKLLSTLSYLSLFYKWGSFLVSPDREIWLGIKCSGKGFSCFQCSSGSVHKGKRKDRAEEKSTRAGTGCSAWLCHSLVTNIPLGLREVAGTE